MRSAALRLLSKTLFSAAEATLGGAPLLCAGRSWPEPDWATPEPESSVTPESIRAVRDQTDRRAAARFMPQYAPETWPENVVF